MLLSDISGTKVTIPYAPPDLGPNSDFQTKVFRKNEDEASSIELSPNITAELNKKGELIGIEILNASTFVQETLMEGVQAKVLQLIPAGK